MDREPVRFGVIGVGDMGAAHAAYLSQMPETQLLAVADVEEERVRRVAAETGAAPYSDYRELLQHRGLEAIVVATPHPFHAVMVRDAARRGLHVLCEKPLAVSVAQADSMIATCREEGVLLGVVYQQRTEPARRAMKHLLEDRVLDSLYRVSLTVSYYRPQAYYNSAPWRGTWKGEGGGILMNQAAHALDQMAWLGGLPQRVQAMTLTRLHDIEVENTALATFDYGGGKAGWFYASTADTLNGERMEVSGERGALVWEDGRLCRWQTTQPMPEHLRSARGTFDNLEGAWHEIAVAEETARYQAVLRAFSLAVRCDDESLMIASAEDGLRSLELANAIILSGHSGQTVELPLDRDRYEHLLQTLQGGAS